MQLIQTKIPDVKILIPKKNGDERGFFSETYNKNIFEKNGINLNFVQDNHSLSAEKGTIRGLHFQTPPYAQDKLLRVIRGSVFDVAIDIRKNSPTFGQHISVVLSAKEWNQILVPIGFAHGFCTLEPDTEVIYKVTNFYAPQHDCGIIWDDPELAIQWPISKSEAILSSKDQNLPRFSELKNLF